MRKNHIFGTANPYDDSEENIRLMKEAGIMMVRLHCPFPFTDESLTETTQEYQSALERFSFYKANGIDIMASVAVASQFKADAQGTVSCVRHYPIGSNNSF